MKDEWSACTVKEKALVDAECAGMLSGLLRADPVLLATTRLWLIRRLLRLWRRSSWFRRWNIASAVSIPAKRGKIRILLPDGFREVLDAFAAGLSPPLSQVHWAWLRGLWGSCGGLYLPRSGYYLALRVAVPEVAAPLWRLLGETQLPWRDRFFHGMHEIFLRGQEGIVTFLCNIGLSETSLQLEDKAIMRSMRDRANRMSNCDTANIRRSLRVSEEQIKLAMRVRDAGLMPHLSPAMRQLVEARLEEPEASLAELGKKMIPPITKSTVKYRWDRLGKTLSDLL